ncbi:MAG TPA: acetylglutamate kinase [bacterium]|nr:acetylglutamate kinase [bacterium]HOL47022.1 acetylglutamate kinase [bacterium]HPQ18476.1 acetylglutamate kinase [bacterium]
MNDYELRCEHIIEALPYIKEFSNKIIVIKYGGAAMENDELKKATMTDITLLKYVGIKPVIIHGGGIEISELMKKVGKKPEFIDGLRVTDSETMNIVEMVLGGKVNKGLVSLLNKNGCKAVGITGKDASTIQAKPKEPIKKLDANGNIIELSLGLVGEIININTDLIDLLLKNDYIPVIAPIGENIDGGLSLNVNADVVAYAVAAKLKAEKLIFMTNVNGILKDINNPDSLIKSIKVSEAEKLIKDGIISEGMIPKIKSCIEALESGVKKVHIINGGVMHSLLLEIFTDAGIGTEIFL